MGTAARAHSRRARALAIVNPSVAFIEQIVRRAIVMNADTGRDSAVHRRRSRRRRSAHGSPNCADSVDDRATRTCRCVLALSPDGRVLGGIGAGAAAHRSCAVRPAIALAMATEDYSAPAGAPYTAEDVVVRTPAGLRFSGTLTHAARPRRGRAPAVVTITGSGPQDRDEHSVGASATIGRFASSPTRWVVAELPCCGSMIAASTDRMPARRRLRRLISPMTFARRSRFCARGPRSTARGSRSLVTAKAASSRRWLRRPIRRCARIVLMAGVRRRRAERSCDHSSCTHRFDGASHGRSA